MTDPSTSTAPRGRRPLPILPHDERSAMNPALTDVIEYRKSGLSVNHVVGCPLDCGYCVRHLFDNFGLKTPRALMSDREAFDLLINHPSFLRDVTPLQILNRATDPMLAAVKPHTLAMLDLLDNAGLRNHVLVITRWRLDADDCALLNSFANIRLTLLVTHSGIIDPRVEPVDSAIAATSLRTAYEHAERFRVVFYWRPLVPGLNDTDQHLAEAMDLTRFAHATVFTGLFYRDQIRAYYRVHGLPEPYEDTARRKILPGRLERRVLAAAAARTGGSPLFRKTSCGVAHAHRMADYNGHYGIRELCDICPSAQVGRCAKAWVRPEPAPIAAAVAGLGGELVAVTERAVMVKGLDEQRRYLLQHTHGYQVHDVAKPHHPHRHGRAELGWNTTEGEASPC